jgi:hypothetical protein
MGFIRYARKRVGMVLGLVRELFQRGADKSARPDAWLLPRATRRGLEQQWAVPAFGLSVRQLSVQQVRRFRLPAGASLSSASYRTEGLSEAAKRHCPPSLPEAGGGQGAWSISPSSIVRFFGRWEKDSFFSAVGGDFFWRVHS